MENPEQEDKRRLCREISAGIGVRFEGKTMMTISDATVVFSMIVQNTFNPTNPNQVV